MRFMMMVKATKEYEQGLPPNPKLLEGMGRLIGEMMQSGVLLACEGLKPSSHGARLAWSGGKRQVTDGPFTETKELIGGYSILQAKSKEEAIQLADRVVEVHVQAGIPHVEIEIRPLFDAGDFAPPHQ